MSTEIERLAAEVCRRGREMPVCTRCDRRKCPWGRSIPMEVGGGVYCRQDDCPEYMTGTVEMLTTDGEAAMKALGFPKDAT